MEPRFCISCFSLGHPPSSSSPDLPVPHATNTHPQDLVADVSCFGSRRQKSAVQLPGTLIFMSSLKRRRQGLEEEVQEITKKLRGIRRQQAAGRRLKISKSQLTTARALMVMRGGEPTAAMDFLVSRHASAEAPATRWAAVQTELREWWRRADVDTQATHTQIGDTNQSMHYAIKQARRFMVDEELEAWVSHQNVSKGINPVPAVTLREARVVKHRVGVDAPSTRRGARQWLQRWRRRRGVRLRKFPTTDPLDRTDMQGKASDRTREKATHRAAIFRNLVSECAKQKRPFFGLEFEAARPFVIESVSGKRPMFFHAGSVFPLVSRSSCPSEVKSGQVKKRRRSPSRGRGSPRGQRTRATRPRRPNA